MVKRKKNKLWLGVDLGGTKVQVAIVDGDGMSIATRRRKTHGKSGDVLSLILDTIRETLVDADLTAADLAGIGFGVPGPLNLDKGVILESPNLGWRNLPLRKRIEAVFRKPVVLANDVDAGGYGEYRFGAAQGARCMLAVFVGTGIGGACIYEGRLMRGKTSSCMEFGHMKIDRNGRRCGCGRRGCLETSASRLAIATDCAAAVFRGEAPRLLALAGTDVAALRSGVIAQAIQEGDRVIEEIVRTAAQAIGLAVSNAVQLLAPDIVVLGGGLVEALPKLILLEATRVAQAEVMSTFRGTFKLVSAKLGDQAGALGAAALAASPEALQGKP